MGGWFLAKFPGACAAEECDAPIKVGDEIMRATSGGYVHVECPEAVAEKPSKFEGKTLEDMGF